MSLFKKKPEPVRVPPNVRKAMDAVNDTLFQRSASMPSHELLEWVETSALGADASNRNYQQQPSLEGAHQLHSLSVQLFALTYELLNREQEKSKRGSTGT